MRILLAINSLDLADIAVQHFRLRPWPTASTIEVLCVVDKVDLSDVPRLVEDITARAEELAHSTAAKIAELGISSLATVLSGNPKDVIVDHAAEMRSDFILIGAHEEVGRRRFLLGSVAKAVLRTAPCSVEVLRAPPGEAGTRRPPRVLLATDGSDCSLLAARSIASRPWPAGTEVRILSVVELGTSLFHVPFPSGAEEALRTKAMQRTQTAIREADEIITKAGLRASEAISVLFVEPESIIAIEAGQWEADLVVLGSHGRRGFKRLLLGSVSEGVALHAGCSVELVRATPVRRQIRYLVPVTVKAQTPALADLRLAEGAEGEDHVSSRRRNSRRAECNTNA
jgi:nucleotide-binding universal stress UspA family protein